MTLTNFTKSILMAIGAVVLMAGSVSAQGDPGLLRNKAVQKELKITEEQAKKLDGFFDELGAKEREAEQKFAQSSPDEQSKMREEMRALATERLNEILKPEQFKRFEQVELQRASYLVFGSPKIQEDLKLTDEQKAKIDAITAEANDTYRKASQKATSNPGKLREDINKATLAKIIALMTPAQKAIWKDLNGTPFEVPRETPGRRARPARRRR
jgi:Spy/CpxP family protein refolding chaperone